MLELLRNRSGKEKLLAASMPGELEMWPLTLDRQTHHSAGPAAAAWSGTPECCSEVQDLHLQGPSCGGSCSVAAHKGLLDVLCSGGWVWPRTGVHHPVPVPRPLPPWPPLQQQQQPQWVSTMGQAPPAEHLDSARQAPPPQQPCRVILFFRFHTSLKSHVFCLSPIKYFI